MSIVSQESSSSANLEQLALDINAEYAKATVARDTAISYAETAVGHAIRVGRLLLEAKARVGYGEWLPWLEANVCVKRSTAYNWMRLAESEIDFQRVGNLSLRDALRLLSAPNDDKDDLPAQMILDIQRTDYHVGSEDGADGDAEPAESEDERADEDDEPEGALSGYTFVTESTRDAEECAAVAKQLRDLRPGRYTIAELREAKAAQDKADDEARAVQVRDDVDQRGFFFVAIDPKDAQKAAEIASRIRNLEPGRYTLDDVKKLKKQQDDADKARKRAAARTALATKAKDADLPSGVHLYNADFRDWMYSLDDASIDLVLTDPPYPKDFLPLWDDLAFHAARVLRPGGLLVAYSGQNFLSSVMVAVEGHLDYRWCIAARNTHGQLRMWGKKVWNSWKPILVWSNGTPSSEWFTDVLAEDEDPDDWLEIGATTTKDGHDWAQPLAHARVLISRFAPIGGVVLDPMCGSGTIPISAVLEGRQGIGIELDDGTFGAARGRAIEVLRGQ